MAEKESKDAVRVVNDKGVTMMAMNSLKRDGDKLTINGILMGAWPTDMFVDPENVARLIKLILKSPSIILYVLSLPIILPRWKKQKANKH
ncbi:MAG: hypothetical protein AAGU17_00535 [Anaerolineaceae bacterium]